MAKTNNLALMGDCDEGCEHEDCQEVPCEPAGSPFATCDSGVIECLQNMLAVVELTFTDALGSDGITMIEWSALNGTYPISMPGRNFCDETSAHFVAVSDALEGVANSFWLKFTDLCDFGAVRCLDYSLECVDGELAVCVSMEAQTTDQTGYAFKACETFAFPITVTNGIEFDLTPLARPTCEASLFPENPDFPESVWPLLATAKLRFYGKPCQEPDECGDGPTADFTYSNVIEDVINACNPLGDLIEINTGCTFVVEATGDAGRCHVLIDIWSTGDTGSGPFTIKIAEACGPFSGDVTLIRIDTAGCIVVVTKALTCCNCCPPVGEGVTRDFYGSEDYCDEDCGFNEGTGVGGCDTTATSIVCGKLTFGNIATTDCGEGFPNDGYWRLDDDGLLACDGSPIGQICFAPEAVLEFQFDQGSFTGISRCVRAFPVDSLSCEGAPVVIPFVAANAYDGRLDEIPAEIDNDCYHPAPFFCDEYWDSI